MDIFSKFKLNAWWKVMLVMGFSLIIVTLTHDIKILNAKYLFLTSCGMVLVGLAMFSAEKYKSIQPFYKKHAPFFKKECMLLFFYPIRIIIISCLNSTYSLYNSGLFTYSITRWIAISACWRRTRV